MERTSQTALQLYCKIHLLKKNSLIIKQLSPVRTSPEKQVNLWFASQYLPPPLTTSNGRRVIITSQALHEHLDTHVRAPTESITGKLDHTLQGAPEALTPRGLSLCFVDRLHNIDKTNLIPITCDLSLYAPESFINIFFPFRTMAWIVPRLSSRAFSTARFNSP